MSDLKLTPGSIYKVASMTKLDETTISEGTFQGFVGLGNVDSLVIEIDQGDEEPLVRLIPAHTVRMLEIVEDATEDEDDDEAEHIHYG